MRTLIILLFISFNSFAQEDIERYKLYPTENINIFLKLDTSKGLMWTVQKASSDVEAQESPINIFSETVTFDISTFNVTLTAKRDEAIANSMILEKILNRFIIYISFVF